MGLAVEGHGARGVRDIFAWAVGGQGDKGDKWFAQDFYLGLCGFLRFRGFRGIGG